MTDLIDVYGHTDVGKKRKGNEDFFKILIPPADLPQAKYGSLFIVADGMGGMGGGDIASRTASEEVIRQFYGDRLQEEDIQTRLALSLESANAFVRGQARQVGLKRIGSTAAGLVLLPDNRALIFNIGDSRVYRIRDKQLELLSRDHTLTAQQGLTQSGQDAGERDNRLTTFIGQPQPVQPIFETVEVQKGDIFIICSDGVWSQVDDRELTEFSQGKSARAIVEKLTRIVLDRGAPDNLTAIVIRVGLRPASVLPRWLAVVVFLILALAIAAAVFLSQNSNTTVSDVTSTSASVVLAEQTEEPPTEEATIISFIEITRTPTPSPTPTDPPTETPLPTNTGTPTLTRTPQPTETFTPTLTPEPSLTFTATSTKTATLTRTPSPTASASPTHTMTPAPTHTPTPSATATRRPTDTPSPTATETAMPTVTLIQLTATSGPASTATPDPVRIPTALIVLEGCSLYDSPGTKAQLLMTVDRDLTAIEVERQDKWLRIQFAWDRLNMIGWISQECLLSHVRSLTGSAVLMPHWNEMDER